MSYRDLTPERRCFVVHLWSCWLLLFIVIGYGLYVGWDIVFGPPHGGAG